MQQYILLPHTADIRIIARGTTIGELFKAGLDAICEILTSEKNTSSGEKIKFIKKLDICSYDQTSLFIDFLSDALTTMHKEKVIITNVEFESIGERLLKCDLYGFNVESFSRDVKAVTYHEADIRQNNNGIYESTIILDI